MDILMCGMVHRPTNKVNTVTVNLQGFMNSKYSFQHIEKLKYQ